MLLFFSARWTGGSHRQTVKPAHLARHRSL